jgi:5'-nucleotidase
MHILLTNDDGIDAPGIEAMYEAVQSLGEIVVVAPQTVQSASSHGITFTAPLMTQEVAVSDRMKGIAVDGRPADCVKLALRALWQERFGAGAKPDITISGMNSGANVGINIIYSGTVAAAVESAFLGVPAMAVSLHIGDRARTRYRRAAWMARQVIDRILRWRLDRHSVININVPRTESDEAPMPPVRVVGMNAAPGTDAYDRRVSPFGHVYYWASGDGMEFTHTAPESDVEALLERCITVTPLTYVLTDQARLQTWRERLTGGPPEAPEGRA